MSRLAGEGARRSRADGGSGVKRIALLAIVAAACAPRAAADRELRLKRLASERQAMMEQLEDLQARLLVDAQRVRFWEEMRDRHESVSAIAVVNLERHAAAIAGGDRPRDKVDAPARKSRLAARVVPSATITR